MRILPSADRREWIVVANWLGGKRTVFGPASIYACTRWVAAQERSAR